MSKNNVFEFTNPDKFQDFLTEYLRSSAQEMVYKAVEMEVTEFMSQFTGRLLPDGKAAVVRNGYQPEREIHRGFNPILTL